MLFACLKIMYCGRLIFTSRMRHACMQGSLLHSYNFVGIGEFRELDMFSKKTTKTDNHREKLSNYYNLMTEAPTTVFCSLSTCERTLKQNYLLMCHVCYLLILMRHVCGL